MPLRAVGANYHAANDGLAAAGAIFEVLDAEPSVRVTAEGVPAPDPRREPVRLERVRFAYPGRPEPVLDRLDLEIGAAETVVLTGPSGAGKSTLASLLLGSRIPTRAPSCCGTTALQRVRPDEWRRRVAWIPQRPTMFAGSLAENVALAEPDAAPEQILAALGEAGATGCSASCRRDSRRGVGEGGGGSLPGRHSASRSPAPSSATRRSSSSTSPPPTSTQPPPSPSAPPSRACWRAAAAC